jgi:hypothetical protein
MGPISTKKGECSIGLLDSPVIETVCCVIETRCQSGNIIFLLTTTEAF